jgi:GR25 family glycosyltransferase involved in LPS biosynthesis
MGIEGFIITLERSIERRPQVERIKTTSPVLCHEIDAVDGKQLSDSEVQKHVRRSMFKPRYPFTLRPGEIGVFLSHRKAWKEIVDRGLDAGLIIEDDVELHSNVFSRSFNLAASNIRPGQYFKFGIKNPGLQSAIGSLPAVTIRAPKVVPLGATAQLVSREAAEKLLNCSEQFDRPVDSFMQLSWITGVEYLSVEPSGITEVSASLGGSTIQVKKRPLGETAYRNIARPIYRTSIWIQSRLRSAA